MFIIVLMFINKTDLIIYFNELNVHSWSLHDTLRKGHDPLF